jgi:outer membrane protein OmpA-like peptidoglycan-associated protein
MRSLLASLLGASVLSAALGTAAGPAHADSTSGVDSHLFRLALDSGGVFSLEGGRLMARRDLSLKAFLGYAQKPFSVAVPGIGGAGGGEDSVLDSVLTLDIAFALAVFERLEVGFGTAVYRTEVGDGYGTRGRYDLITPGKSTGLQSLRLLSNLDPAGGFEDQSLSGPLDVRTYLKYGLVAGPRFSMALAGIVHLPFGEDEMFLGDQNLVFEPRLALELRLSRVKSTRLVANVGARFRERTVLEAYDPTAMDENGELLTADDAQVVLDIGSEIVAGFGGIFEISPRLNVGAEAMVFLPYLPDSLSYGDCRRDNGTRCSSIDDVDYFAGGKKGDRAVYTMGGVNYRVTAHTTLSALGGAGLVGARGDEFRFIVGAVWSPQPENIAVLGRGDADADGIPDVSDVCSDEPEDRDGYQDDDGCPDIDNDGDGVADAQDACADEPEDRDNNQDEDGCPERDNDADGIQDVADRCPDEKEDVDGFEDDDGCADEDNDGDGFADKGDRCPNDPETVNGVDDDDGCPDIRAQTGPQEAADRIDLRGNKVEFAGNSDRLTNASRIILGQVASLIKDRTLTIRVEVHTALGTRSKNARQITRQKQRDKDLSQRRAQAILDYLAGQGVPLAQLQAVGLGSDRPLGANPPEDSINERVDFIKAQQRQP